jgi:hypothetical protein
LSGWQRFAREKLGKFLYRETLDPEPLFSVSLPKGKAICSNLFKSVQEQKENSRIQFSSPLSLEGEQNRKNSGLLR